MGNHLISRTIEGWLAPNLYQCQTEPGFLDKCHYIQHTINLLDASAIIFRKLEVFRVHPLIEGSHDGRGVIGVLQTQRMPKFMHRYKEDVITWKDKSLF